jgi:hypothetical protein
MEFIRCFSRQPFSPLRSAARTDECTCLTWTQLQNSSHDTEVLARRCTNTILLKIKIIDFGKVEHLKNTHFAALHEYRPKGAFRRLIASLSSIQDFVSVCLLGRAAVEID